MAKVNQKFMNDLADKIYDPKNKTFLRLCSGILQNGPDPTNKKRPMHCGLGELYFAVTGRHPESDNVCEEDVTEVTIDRSTIETNDAIVKRFRKGLNTLGLPKSAIELIEDPELDEWDVPTPENKMRTLLDSIPNANDDCISTDSCTVGDFRARSRRVATVFRKVAKLLE